MNLGVYAVGTGNHVSGWRVPGAATSSEDFSIFKTIADSCERGKLDFLFVGDSLAFVPDQHPGQMLRFEPCGCTVEYGAVDSSTTKGFWLRLIQVKRDAAGKLYLYRACGYSSRRAVIGDGALLLLGGEDWRLPIVAMTRDEQGVTLQLDVSKVPEVFRCSRMALQRHVAARIRGWR
jgi:hypothetical protein